MPVDITGMSAELLTKDAVASLAFVDDAGTEFRVISAEPIPGSDEMVEFALCGSSSKREEGLAGFRIGVRTERLCRRSFDTAARLRCRGTFR